jgi:hypothetical protein
MCVNSARRWGKKTSTQETLFMQFLFVLMPLLHFHLPTFCILLLTQAKEGRFLQPLSCTTSTKNKVLRFCISHRNSLGAQKIRTATFWKVKDKSLVILLLLSKRIVKSSTSHGQFWISSMSMVMILQTCTNFYGLLH